MKMIVIAGSIAAGLAATACTSSGNTERGALSGAILGGVAGARFEALPLQFLKPVHAAVVRPASALRQSRVESGPGEYLPGLLVRSNLLSLCILECRNPRNLI